ncbi:MAG: BMP family ABC transporter substrate-binding protein [Eubacteriales bacterium]|nr:BMP family ABC transporter substrate-binding protein [Christensenellaceae bacterium]MDY3241971.1 BMP family ABC transporter substrate-binding protein [Eubacteriales bacterium]MDY6078677.1 BMP family ABC transporter substrate-binding protein [Eubacteriales bacterium]
MKKKIFAILLVVAMVAALAVGFTACDGNGGDEGTAKVVSFDPIEKSNIHFGLITLHGEESTYDKNFIDAAKAACKNMGVKITIKSGIPEGDECYQAAADLVQQGCNIIFADSFGHEPYMLKAAKEFPNVRFCHATGTTAHTELQPNFYNAFASIYEGRFLAGVAAGMKINEMIEKGQISAAQAKMGYVGAYTYAEVISGLTSFYLGAKYVCPSVTMDVKFTGSWYDQVKEEEAANALIDGGCILISQHADSMGAPNACANKKVPNVTYNINTASANAACADTYLIGSKINWQPYYEYVIKCTINGVSALGFDWTGNLETGSVELLDLNETIAAAGTKAKLEEVKNLLISGELHVFDTAKDNYILKDGKKLESYKADVDTDDNFTADTFVIVDGYFHESVYRSAPYFDVQIDGINFLNSEF